MSSADSDRPKALERCPRCGYALRGLPPVGVCPECGLAYDPDCEVIRLRPLMRDYRQVVFAAVILLVAFAAWKTSGEAAFWWLAAPAALGLLIPLWRIARYGGAPHELILNRAGIEICGETLRRKHLAWDEFERVYVTWVWRVDLVLAIGRWKKVWRCPAECLGGRLAAWDCAARIAQKRQHYLAAGDGGGRPA